MTVEEDIERYHMWAIKMGFPPKAIPSDEALKSVFKSPQRDVFYTLMERVKPKDEIKAIRENILINKMRKTDPLMLNAGTRSFLPKEMQTYLKHKDLQQKKEHLEHKIDEHCKEYDVLLADIKAKNIQTIDWEYKKENVEAKLNILQSKSESLVKDLNREKKNQEKIQETLPIQLNAQNASEQAANDAVEKALKELESFYTLCASNEHNASILQEAKDDLWKKVSSIFANVPNFLLFNAMMQLKDQQLENIKFLNKSNLNDSQLMMSTSTREPMSSFEIKMFKAKADFLGMVAKYSNAVKERMAIEERFSEAYEPFFEELQKKINLFNPGNEDRIDDIISSYVVQYHRRNMFKSKNEFLTQQIEVYKTEIEHFSKMLENHEILLGSINDAYGKINASVNRTQYEVNQFSQIKEKIKFSRNLLKLQFEEMESAGNKTQINIPKLLVNNSTISMMGLEGDSFEMTGDGVFCSTKLEFDSPLKGASNTILRRSFGSNDNTLVAATTVLGGGGSAPTTGNDLRYNLPSHVQELNTFLETPLQQLCCMSKESAFYLTPNPLAIDTHELSSTLQLAPGILLTPWGSLKEVRLYISWAKLISEHSNLLQIDLDLIQVDGTSLSQKSKEQHENMSEKLDKMETVIVNTRHKVVKTTSLLKFFLDNPLRHFIPNTKLYNNQTYAGYESEFMMHYRLVSGGTQIKK